MNKTVKAGKVALKPEDSDGEAWRHVGTVVGNTGITEYTFILQQYQAKLGDIVAVRMEVPGSDGRREIYVWARITDISRFNPFFPYEAAQEIAGEGISLEDTVLSGTRDQLEAKALILGTTAGEDVSRLLPLTYPVKPATRVYYPPAEAVRQLLVGGREGEQQIQVGALVARQDVGVTMSAPKLVARHMAILAMTGGGKTVAARRMIRELIGHGYPLLIIDPHGDYIGLWKCRELLAEEAPGAEVRLFFPELLVQRDGEDLITKLVGQMTSGMTEPQSEYLRGLYERRAATDGTSALDYIGTLVREINSDLAGTTPPRGAPGNWRPTVLAVSRGLRIVRDRLERMKRTSEQMRASPKLRTLGFQPLPNPFGRPEDIIRPKQVSILYLGGYDHITQCSIAAITLETLFERRADLRGRIPPFMTVLEEAHTFIPSAREGTEDAVSLPVVRRMITEGRKFGTGLILISQRPSRLDETIVSQCNSFLILRLVNPRDQTFVRSIMENLTESDSKMIPGFGPGQGILSGQVVRFPLPVQVQMDADLLNSEIGDEDFFDQVDAWRPDAAAPARAESQKAVDKIDAIAKKRAASGAATKSGTKRRKGR
ncbi:MAG: ATP-binding protein [Rubrivivax sp.]|nr:ATP-binding protein [Rubrivivax sp.]